MAHAVHLLRGDAAGTADLMNPPSLSAALMRFDMDEDAVWSDSTWLPCGNSRCNVCTFEEGAQLCFLCKDD